MTNKEIAILLRNIAAAYDLLGESPFRTRAYRQAADSVENMSKDLSSLWKEGAIRTVPGIGGSLAQHFDELFTKGSSKHFSNIEAKMPPGMFDFLKLRKVGPKTAFQLAKEIKKQSISGRSAYDKLKKLLDSHELLDLEGFGEKREREIAESLAQYLKGATKKKRLLLPQAEAVSNKLLGYILKNTEVIRADALGSLRRKKDSIGDIDIAVATKNTPAVANHILAYPDLKKVDDKGATRLAFLVEGTIQVDVRLIHPDSYGSMLQYFTGSKYHNIRLREYALKRGLSLSEWGVKKVQGPGQTDKGTDNIKKFTTEKDFYAHIGLDFIHPELREDNGEIEAAAAGTLPALVQETDIKGDIHIHGDIQYPSSHDVGRSPLHEILAYAKKQHYEYIAISDHNPKRTGLPENDLISVLKARRRYYDHNISNTKSVHKKTSEIKVYNMLEIDIRPNGELALPEIGFSFIDAAIVSIHTSFTMQRDQMTARILRALSHKKVRLLAHPTGRLIDKRESIQADWGKIFTYCKENDIALEINASPRRLDLPDTLVLDARKAGVKFVINTDSHHVSQMPDMRYGVAVARRGWLTKDDILNTQSREVFETWLLRR